MPAASFPSIRRLIRALRLSRGLTQEALAERAGLDYKYYQRLELGETDNPTVGTLELLGKAFGVRAWVLLCDEMEIVTARTGLTHSALVAQDKGRKIGRPKKASKP